MPEEPDVSPEEMEILDRVWRKRIEAKERQREEQINAIADRILEALQSRGEGMQWAEIRDMFDKNSTDEQIRKALLTLMQPPLRIKIRVENTRESFLLAAS